MPLRRLFDLPLQQLQDHPKADALVAVRGAQWTRYSSREVAEQIDLASAALLARGIARGDRIAILSESRPEWNIADLAVQQIGAIAVPIDPRTSAPERAFILADAQVRLAFVGNGQLGAAVQVARREVPCLKEICAFDGDEGGGGWKDLLSRGAAADRRCLARIRCRIRPDDLATVVYTSGTTGQPKGVMLSHRNILSNVEAALAILPVDQRHRALSFLPLNHMFERMMTYLYMAAGVSIYYAESIQTIGPNLRDVKPHVFTTVPRVLEKTYERIAARGEALTGLRRRLFDWALRLGTEYELRGKGPGYRLQLRLARKLVFAKWRSVLGGELIAVICGGAPLDPRLARVFTAAGVPVLEGYGLTETSPVIAVNRLASGGRKFGSVGKVLDGVEVRIAADGEILCRGPNVMLGYYRRPDSLIDRARLALLAPVRRLARAGGAGNGSGRGVLSPLRRLLQSAPAPEEKYVDAENWFHTGDLGGLDDEGFLRITGRKKSMFKTSGGEYVVPERIEDLLKRDALVEDAVITGAGRKQVTALIAPDFGALKAWCRKSAIPWTTEDAAIRVPAVRQRYEEAVHRCNADLGPAERIRGFELVSDKWTVETGERTPTLKLKRDAVAGKYSELIEGMYAS